MAQGIEKYQDTDYEFAISYKSVSNWLVSQCVK